MLLKYIVTIVSLFLLLLFSISTIALGVDTIHHLPFPGHIGAAYWNPALLGVSPYGFNLEMNYLMLSLWTDGWAPNQILYRINDYWDEEVKEELLDAIRKDSLSTGMGLTSGLYLGSNNWAFSANVRGQAQMGLGKDLFRLLLYGTEVDPEFALDLSNTYFKSSFILDTAFHRAFSLEALAASLEWDSFYLGGGLHILSGLSWLDMRSDVQFSTVFESEDEAYFEGEAEVEILYSLSGLNGGGGLGLGLDLGLFGEIGPDIGVGISVTDLGFMRWDGVYRDYYKGRYKWGHPLSTVEDEEEYWETLNERQAPLYVASPISIHAGGYIKAHPRVDLAGSIGLRDIPDPYMYGALSSRLHLPRFLPVILAVEYDGYQECVSLSASFGLKIGGFEPLTITLSDLLLFAGEGREAALGLHTSFRF